MGLHVITPIINTALTVFEKLVRASLAGLCCSCDPIGHDCDCEYISQYIRIQNTPQALHVRSSYISVNTYLYIHVQ